MATRSFLVVGTTLYGYGTLRQVLAITPYPSTTAASALPHFHLKEIKLHLPTMTLLYEYGMLQENVAISSLATTPMSSPSHFHREAYQVIEVDR
jgi:hypothetical protein